MKTIKNKMVSAVALFAVVLTIGISGCKKEETPEPNKTTYDLKIKDQVGISGTVTFTETSNTVTTIDITMVGGDSQSHPTHIHTNSAIEGGTIAISLNPVVNGHSSTQVTKQDDNTAINYSQLIVFNGYLNIHESNADLATILAQADIGGNALTTTNKTYTLDAVGTSGVSGTALFEKRNNGNTLVTINITGTIAGDFHPAVIHIGSVATVGGGPAVKTLNAVNGTTGKSVTNLSNLDNGTAISYDNVMVYDGYLAIHQSTLLMQNVLCQGNIGSN